MLIIRRCYRGWNDVPKRGINIQMILWANKSYNIFIEIVFGKFGDIL